MTTDLPYDDEGALRRSVAGARDMVGWRFEPERMRARTEAWSKDSYYRESVIIRAKQVYRHTVEEWSPAEIAKASRDRDARYFALMAKKNKKSGR